MMPIIEQGFQMKMPAHKYSHLFLGALIVMLSWLSAAPVEAAPLAQEIDCSNLPPVNWQETNSDVFAYVYPAEFEMMVDSLLLRFGSTLEEEYHAFSRLFQTSLSLPVTIRIYPGIRNYYCLNVIAPQVAVGVMHSRIGMREISLFGDRIWENFSQWDEESLNILRYELGVLFVEQISEGKAPPGLLGGVGFYMMDPNDIFEQRNITEASYKAPEVTWRSLWESDETLSDPGEGIQAVSTIAYLVEAYGWDTFMQLLVDLRTSEGYRHSLNEVYGVDFSVLQSEWANYYPLYYQGRWRSHVLYGFDLKPYAEMIAGGAYTDALINLKDVVEFLEQNDQGGKLSEALALQELAKSGQEASALVLQSRQALQNGQYNESIRLADQAQAIFNTLGDLRRTAELDSYRAWAQEVQALQTEMEQLRQEYAAGDDSTNNVDRMIQVSQRLAELGESQALESMTEIIAAQEAVQKSQRELLYILLSVVTVLLVALRIWLIRYKPPRESRV